MSPLQTRKKDLLLESTINRQVLKLEVTRLRQMSSYLDPELLRGKWSSMLPVAGLVVAWTLRQQLSGISRSLLGKLWRAFTRRRQSANK